MGFAKFNGFQHSTRTQYLSQEDRLYHMEIGKRQKVHKNTTFILLDTQIYQIDL